MAETPHAAASSRSETTESHHRRDDLNGAGPRDDVRGHSLRFRSATAVLRERFACEAGYGLEDCVVGDERDPETDRGRGDPAVGVVLALRESVTDRGAVGPQLGTDRYELGAGVDDLRAPDLAVELQHPRLPPAAPDRPVAQLRGRLEGD